MTDRPGGYVTEYEGNDPFGKPMISIRPGAEWTDKAATWPVITVSRKTEPGHMYATVEHEQPWVIATHLCCAECPGEPSVFCLSPDLTEPGYRVTVADMMAGILSHIRRTHST